MARQLDLLSYLQQYRPHELVKQGNGVYTMRSHDSLKLSNGRWYRWATGTGGVSALESLVGVEQMSFVEAVQHICHCIRFDGCAQRPAPLPKPVTAFVLPKRNGNNMRVTDYLMQRGLSRTLIEKCIAEGLLYEDTRHNCCFVGKDQNGIAKYAMLRGTMPDSTFCIDVRGSNKEYAFHFSAGDSNTLYLFESAIDLLSYCDLHKNPDGHFLSVGGVYQPNKHNVQNKLPLALSHYLSRHEGITQINICFDNDDPGRIAAEAIRKLLQGEYDVKLMPPEVGKDYNDQLIMERGITPRVKTRCEKSTTTKEEINK